jgi:hypothetical protein
MSPRRFGSAAPFEGPGGHQRGHVEASTALVRGDLARRSGSCGGGPRETLELERRRPALPPSRHRRARTDPVGAAPAAGAGSGSMWPWASWRRHESRGAAPVATRRSTLRSGHGTTALCALELLDPSDDQRSGLDDALRCDHAGSPPRWRLTVREHHPAADAASRPWDALAVTPVPATGDVAGHPGHAGRQRPVFPGLAPRHRRTSL